VAEDRKFRIQNRSNVMFRWLFEAKRRREANFSSFTGRLLKGIEGACHAVTNMNGRTAGTMRRLDVLLETVNDIHQTMLKQIDSKAEAELGPYQYEITGDDLRGLGATERYYVSMCNTMYFNDIYAAKLGGLPDCGVGSIANIMQWKRDCVSRITQEQADDALDAQVGGN
jgi:hypothetical protein